MLILSWANCVLAVVADTRVVWFVFIWLARKQTSTNVPYECHSIKIEICLMTLTWCTCLFVCFYPENPTHQGDHVLPSTLVISLLLIIVVLLTIYCLRWIISLHVHTHLLCFTAFSLSLYFIMCVLSVCVGSRHQGGGGVETGGVQWLMGRQLHLM